MKVQKVMGSTFGENFKLITFGESHGKGVGVVMDNVKPGIKLDMKALQHQMNRRRPGQSKVVTPRNEADQIQILSGIFEGKTTGAPICMVVFNKDQDSSKYDNLKKIFRPGHADFCFYKKYGIRDHRGGGRSSGRETLARVAAGAVALQMLKGKGVKISAYCQEIGGIASTKYDPKEIENNIVRCPDKKAAVKMVDRIMAMAKIGESVGGIIEVRITGLPVGLGDPVFDKLEASLTKAIISIGATKGVEIGRGFESARLLGSENNDAQKKKKFNEMKNGGILGGMSTGADIVLRLAVKPTSSITKKQFTEDIKGNNTTIQVFGRHDPCICPRIVPVVEAMIALVLYDKLCFQQRIKYSKTTLAHKKQLVKTIDEEIVSLLAERELVLGEYAEIENGKAKKPKKRTATQKKADKEKALKLIERIAKRAGLDQKTAQKVFKQIL